ncbi:MAG: polyprenyl synthetase family protein [Desulfonatronovibrio sp.]
MKSLSFEQPDFKKYFKEISSLVQEHLSGCLSGLNIPEALYESMTYSLLAGGKRVRPVLCISWAGMLGIERQRVLDFSCAIEFIHTYSLVHDDLPAMDDDDLRRGCPTNHKVHGEAMAILAGDALLTHAFYLMSETDLPAENVLSACREIAKAAGPSGMVGGQVVDILATGADHLDLDSLKKMHAMKTGALIRSSCVCGALLAGSAGAGQKDMANAADFGESIGLAFQIVDDILDITGDEKSLGKPVGSDQSRDKATYPRFLGLDKSRKLAQESVDRARQSLRDYSGPEKEFLSDLAQYIVDRIN